MDPDSVGGRVGTAARLWSNDVVADTDASESPWADDVPAPPGSSLPDDPWADRHRAGPRSVADPADRLDPRADAQADTERPEGDRAAPAANAARRARLLLAAVAVAAVAVGSLVLSGNGDGEDGVGGGAARGGTETLVDGQLSGADDTAVSAVREDGRATTTVPGLTPVVTPDELPDDETVVPTTVALDALVPDLQPVSIGVPPAWTEWTYPTPPGLRQLTEPTELVALTADGVLHRLEFPSGTVSSIDTAAAGRNAAMYVSGESIALQKFDSLVLFRPDTPLREVEIGVGIGTVIPRGDTGEFLVAPNEWSGGPPPLWLVTPEGEATSLATADSPLGTYADFPVQFLRTGELLVVDAGGTYVVPDTGTPQRLSPGVLFATGRRHVIVRECDETLQCEFVVIDLVTGDRRRAALDVDDRFAFYSQGSVAPDGRTMLYADWNGARPASLLMDLDTGAVVDDELLRAAPLDFGALDNWSGDGSGVFLRTGSSIGFLTRDGSVGVELDGLGVIAALAVR